MRTAPRFLLPTHALTLFLGQEFSAHLALTFLVSSPITTSTSEQDPTLAAMLPAFEAVTVVQMFEGGHIRRVDFLLWTRVHDDH